MMTVHRKVKKVRTGGRRDAAGTQIEPETWVDVAVDVCVDFDAIASDLAHKAFRSKRGRSQIASGNVVVKLVK